MAYIWMLENQTCYFTCFSQIFFFALNLYPFLKKKLSFHGLNKKFINGYILEFDKFNFEINNIDGN